MDVWEPLEVGVGVGSGGELREAEHVLATGGAVDATGQPDGRGERRVESAPKLCGRRGGGASTVAIGERHEAGGVSRLKGVRAGKGDVVGDVVQHVQGEVWRRVAVVDVEEDVRRRRGRRR